MFPRQLLVSLLAGAASAQAGWRIIARDIGGGALGTAFFEDGVTGICVTSQILPAGYEIMASNNSGVTWSSVAGTYRPFDALYNVAAYGAHAIASADFIILQSNDSARTFADSNAPAGGQIVRKLAAADGRYVGFAILGETTAGDVNGAVVSRDGGASWAPVNIPWSNAGILSIDGSFLNDTWTVVGNVYETSLRDAATYNTEVATSTDGGATWRTAFSNSSVAALGIACVDAATCCLATENGDNAFILCTADGWTTVSQALADMDEGAAIVELDVAPGTCAGGGDAIVAVGGDVAPSGGQAPGFWRSCDGGKTFTKDATPAWPVANLLVTDIDCQPHAPNGTACWATLWDNSGLEPNTFIAKYFAA